MCEEPPFDNYVNKAWRMFNQGVPMSDDEGDFPTNYAKKAPTMQEWAARVWPAEQAKMQAAAASQDRTTPEQRMYSEQVSHPPHYTAHPSGVECITITEHMTFCLGNAVKYLWRADLKNGIEDLEKAKWYIEREIARRKKL